LHLELFTVPSVLTTFYEIIKLRFYNIAQGSIEESRYYLILTKDLEYGDVSELSQLLEEVSKLLEAYSQVVLTSDS